MTKDTKQIYINACEECDAFEPTNPLRLSLFLNYSVFLYQIAELVDDARLIAKRAFDEALFELRRLRDHEMEETLPLM